MCYLRDIKNYLLVLANDNTNLVIISTGDPNLLLTSSR